MNAWKGLLSAAVWGFFGLVFVRTRNPEEALILGAVSMAITIGIWMIPSKTKGE